MKEGWEYKKLEEICTKGSSNISLNKIEDNSGEYKLYGASGLVKGIDFYHQEKSYIGIVKDGSGVGRVDIYPSKSSLVGTMQYIFPKEGCEIGFLKYLLQGLHLENYKTGAAIPHIYFKDYGKSKVPIPPLSEQQHIVEELDLLSSIIEKKKAQLNELDNLAQSLFYEMFGDPITNEKGWEVKKMGEVCQSELGKTLNKSKDKGELHPYLCSINILWGNINISTLKQARFEKDEIEKYSVKRGDLLVCEGGDIGRAAIWDREESMLYQNALHRIRFINAIIPVFCLYFLQTLKQKGIIDNRYGKGVTIKHLVKSSLLSIPITIPPINLQNQFASQIQTIEHQKELIKQSIKEVETLFNSRMDDYFN